jgi:3-oxoacyl-[acyl-carrier-protein] synthase II
VPFQTVGNPQRRRVVVTGIGALTPVGIGIEETWANLLAGKSGVARITSFDPTDCPWKIAGEVKGFEPEKYLGKKEARHMDRFTQLGLVAAHWAIEDAKLSVEKENPERMGCAVGTAMAGFLFGAQQYDVFKEKGYGAISPYLGISIFTGSCGAQISRYLGLKAASMTISTGCDCATAAVAHAAETIRRGEADVIVTGGAEATVHPIIIASFGCIFALSERNDEPERASRPFDRERDGFVMSEGACMLVLEELDHALARGAHIYAEIAGAASSCDAYHMTSPAPDGAEAVRAIEQALWEAGVAKHQVDYINMHGTSTPIGDATETFVMKKTFGDIAYRIPCSSTKSMTGHMQGATGAVEIAACLLAMRDSRIPPTINQEYPDPACDLDYVPNRARAHRVNIALSNSFSFGGRNTVIVLKRHANGHSVSHANGNGSS